MRTPNKKNKMPLTWWVGWWILYPVRLVGLLAASFILAAVPSEFWAVINVRRQTVPTKWRLD